jgi:TetR/AcrR family transcriptional repressor of nem operon
MMDILKRVKSDFRVLDAMRVSQDEKDRSHRRIVAAAARLVRERGLESTSVADVMSEAGLTHGGFYRHFDTKDSLSAAALQSAFGQIQSELASRLETTEPGAAVAGFHAHYLSEGHVSNPGIGCPIAALAGEVGRASETLKTAFGCGVNRLITQLAMGMPGSESKRRAKATRELAMLAGAVMIARASDPETARAVLSACRAGSK